MSPRGKQAPGPAGKAPTVLAVVAEGRLSAAAEALAAAGCRIEFVNRVSSLAGRLADMAPDALLIDLASQQHQDGGGPEIRQVLCTLADLDSALREVERLRQTVDFARATAHNLAQPLTTILARSQLLMSAMKPEDSHYRALGIICAETERLADAAKEFNKLKAMAAEPAAQKA